MCDGFGAYAASKAAVRAFARTWANELKGRGIHVDAVSPGSDRHPRHHGTLWRGERAFCQSEPRCRRRDGADGPLGGSRRMVAFLASAQSSDILGANLYVDGGENQM